MLVCLCRLASETLLAGCGSLVLHLCKHQRYASCVFNYRLPRETETVFVRSGLTLSPV